MLKVLIPEKQIIKHYFRFKEQINYELDFLFMYRDDLVDLVAYTRAKSKLKPLFEKAVLASLQYDNMSAYRVADIYSNHFYDMASHTCDNRNDVNCTACSIESKLESIFVKEVMETADLIKDEFLSTLKYHQKKELLKCYIATDFLSITIK